MDKDRGNNLTQIFTICSNNYLAQALTLGKSLKINEPEMDFAIILMDRLAPEIDYKKFSIEIIPIENILSDVPTLIDKYNIIEFNTAVKPVVFQYFFNKRSKQTVLYFDPDICIYNKLDLIFEELNTHEIVLTPHILTPTPNDGLYPGENNVLQFGLYNLGFLGVTKGEESIRMLDWWKGHTFLRGYINLGKGQFTDQLPMTLVPLFFKNVKVLRHLGMNMAPWNLHERFLKEGADKFQLVNDDMLIFYHFSEFRPGQLIKISKNGWYNRYTLEERKDLQKLYEEYNNQLLVNDYEKLRLMPCIFYKNKKRKKTIRTLSISTLERIIKILKSEK